MKQSVGKFSKTPVKIFAYRKTEEDSVFAYARANSIKLKLQRELLRKISSISSSAGTTNSHFSETSSYM